MNFPRKKLFYYAPSMYHNKFCNLDMQRWNQAKVNCLQMRCFLDTTNPIFLYSNASVVFIRNMNKWSGGYMDPWAIAWIRISSEQHLFLTKKTMNNKQTDKDSPECCLRWLNLISQKMLFWKCKFRAFIESLKLH